MPSRPVPAYISRLLLELCEMYRPGVVIDLHRATFI